MSSADLFPEPGVDPVLPTPPPLPPQPVVPPRPVDPNMPAKPSSAPLWFMGVVICCLLFSQGALVWFMLHPDHGATPAPPTSPLPAAVREYNRTLPGVFHDIELQLQAGTLTKKSAIVTTMLNHSLPLGTALNATLDPLVDKTDQDTITNKDAAAQIFHDAYVALGGK